ncbi:FRIGIDA-like protein 1 [Forsythia ovata]|uniref:FRIGIDA-like protein 1 n=1 Tax=Forsythia ovata TaxID=205694 RepID=A0ABD1QAD0_9LAMI
MEGEMIVVSGINGGDEENGEKEKSCLIDTKKLAQKVRKTGKHSRQLLSQYPKDGLVTCIESLEKEKTDRSQCAAKAVSKPKKLKPKHRKKWREKQRQAAAGLSTIKKNDPHNSAIPSSQSSHLQSAGLLSDHVAPYIGPPAVAYGMPGPLQAAAPYVSSFADLYGIPGGTLDVPWNLNSTASNLYPSEQHIELSHYDRTIGNGGYDVPPQYHPAYYPQ